MASVLRIPIIFNYVFNVGNPYQKLRYHTKSAFSNVVQQW